MQIKIGRDIMSKIKKFLVVIMAIAMMTVMMPAMAFGAASDSGGGHRATKSSDSITVYVSISNDGDFVTGNDGTVMARVPVQISYFDLADYGLQDFYRYEADTFENGGKYLYTGTPDATKVIKQPTLLHLYIKVLEQYYACRTLAAADMHSDIINVTGSATSMYMKNFWGHDENLMYYVDHAYPLQTTGWGSTADYILLRDGMEIDLGMFSDWDFYKTGAFAYFDKTSANTTTGNSVTLTMRGTATNAAQDGSSSFSGQAMPGEPVRVSSDGGHTWQTDYATTDDNGQVTLKFSKAGTYYISGGPLFKNFPSELGTPDVVPPVSVITVTDSGSSSGTGGGTIGGGSGSGGTGGSGADASKIAAPVATVSSTGTDSAKVEWKAVDGATSYTAYVKKNADTQWTSQTVEGTFKIFTGLDSGTKYDFKVVANGNVNGSLVTSADSKIVSATTGAKDDPSNNEANKPGKIKSLKAKTTKGKITLTWKNSKPAFKLTGYQIYKSTKKSTGFKKVATVKKTKCVIKKGLKKKKSYYIKVRGYKKASGKVIYTSWKTIKVKAK